MDYQKIAEELIELHEQLRLLPTNQALSNLEKGSFFALHCLLSQGRPLCPKELSRIMGVSSARIAALLNHLEKEGLAQRSPDPQDSRQVLVTLTDLGRQSILEKQKQIRQMMTKMLEALGPEDAQALLRIQRKLAEQLLSQKGAAEKEEKADKV